MRGTHYAARRRRRGFSLVDTLVASVVFCIGAAALVRLWAFSFTIAGQTDELGIAYNLARQQVEAVKVSGFDNAPEGAWTDLYFNQNQAQVAGSSGAAFKVTTSIASSAAWPSTTCTRTVTVTVYRVVGNAKMLTTGTVLVRGGI